MSATSSISFTWQIGLRWRSMPSARGLQSWIATESHSITMRALLYQLRARLILGSLVFLLALTVPVILVVRDSLSFSARNMVNVGEQALLDQQQKSLLEI